jgi:hypothetical protein
MIELNWKTPGTFANVNKITAIMSILETCKRHQINTRDCLLNKSLLSHPPIKQKLIHEA